MHNCKDFPEKTDVVITCASGTEKVVKSELKRMGLPEGAAVNGAITIPGNALTVASCNVNLRCADRVYVKVAQFTAITFDELFEGTLHTEWARYLPTDAAIAVTGKCVKSTLFSVSACQSIVKKAVVESLKSAYRINTVAEDGALYRVEFWVFKDQVTLLINTSGAGLHKRGYRDLVGIAPLKETLASSLLLLSDYYWQRPFADPFCGSGTLCIEAAHIALNIAPGLNRDFDFASWRNFDKTAFALAKERAKDEEKRDRKIYISGSDVDGKAIKLAKRHAERAGLKGIIDFTVKDVRYFEPQGKNGTIVTNPPYGERVYDVREAEECYANIGRIIRNYPDWSVFAITSAKSFEKCVKKRADRERKLYNSNLECKYYYYYGKKEK